jgi:hypothetical protein
LLITDREKIPPRFSPTDQQTAAGVMLLPVSWYHLPEKSAGRCCYPLPIMQPEEVRGLASDHSEEARRGAADSKRWKMLYIIYI